MYDQLRKAIEAAQGDVKENAVKAAKGAVMTPEHPGWAEFCKRLSGPEGCDFKDGKWKCAAGRDKTFATRILKAHYPDVDIDATVSFFERLGGYCDCEILFNVESSWKFGRR